MDTNRAKDCHTHAEYCSQQSHSTHYGQVKKYWDDLAYGWLALENAELQQPSAREIKLR